MALERLGTMASLAYIRDATGDDREPHSLADDTISAAVARREGNLDLAAADLRDLLESRTGSDFGSAWARRTAELRTKGESRVAFNDRVEILAQFGDVMVGEQAAGLEPAGPPRLILLSVLRTHTPNPTLNRYFREADFLNEPRTDHVVWLPEIPSFERGIEAGRRFLAVALTYPFDAVYAVDSDGERFPNGNDWSVNFPSTDATFSQHQNLSFTRDGRDFKIYTCNMLGGLADLTTFETRFLKFVPDDDTAGS